MANWKDALDDRQRKEIGFAELYARDFNHGTTGHNQLLLIATMATMIDHAEAQGVVFEKPDRADVPLGFGKYSAKTLRELATEDYGYVEWLASKGNDADVREAAERVINEVYQAERHLVAKIEAGDPPF